MKIYQGNSLRVDLTRREIRRGRTPEIGIGGRTWNSITLLEELSPGIDVRQSLGLAAWVARSSA